MNADYSQEYFYGRYDSDWVMEQLERQLALSELAGEGDFPPWAVF